MWSIM